MKRRSNKNTFHAPVLLETAALSLFLAIPLQATAQSATGVTAIMNNGDSNNRVDIVAVGDGYTQSEQSLYNNDIDDLIHYMFSDEAEAGKAMDPYPRYRNFFNFHRVNIVSNESGADDYTGIPEKSPWVDRDTALGADYGRIGQHAQVTVDGLIADGVIYQALNGDETKMDIKMAPVNSSRHSGTGAYYGWMAYSARAADALALAAHETGHSFGILADEYFDYTRSPQDYRTYPAFRGEPENVNVSVSGGKWTRWMGYDDPTNDLGPIGEYVGGKGFELGIVRPTDESKMRFISYARAYPFNAVSREQLIKRIYEIVDPLDSHTANGSTLKNPGILRVSPVDSDVIAVNWFVDGRHYNSGLSLDTSTLSAGTYTVEAQAHDTVLDHKGSSDELDWWRLDEDLLRQKVTWTVEIGSGSTGGNDPVDVPEVEPTDPTDITPEPPIVVESYPIANNPSPYENYLACHQEWTDVYYKHATGAVSDVDYNVANLKLRSCEVTLEYLTGNATYEQAMQAYNQYAAAHRARG